MSCCRCTQPLETPVLPEEYSQNAGSSLLVGCASRSGDAESISGRSEGYPPPAPATTISRRYRKRSRGIDLSCGSRLSLTTATRARQSLKTCSYSRGLYCVLMGTATAPILIAPKKE